VGMEKHPEHEFCAEPPSSGLPGAPRPPETYARAHSSLMTSSEGSVVLTVATSWALPLCATVVLK